MITFSDEELDSLMSEVSTTQKNQAHWAAQDGIIVTDAGLVPRLSNAITYLRAQLSERDPIGASIMRERALKAATDDAASARIGSAVAYRMEDETAKRVAFYVIAAGERIAKSIRAIPLPMPAETLAYALQLPEIKAHVEAIRRLAFAWEANVIIKGGPHTITLPDGSTHTGPVVDFLHDIALVQIEALRSTLAALEPKP